MHFVLISGEKPYKCLLCTRMFVSTGVLRAHMKTHSGVKDYKCQVCQATFTTNGSLTRHMMVHSSLRPFKCPYCNETFRTSAHCKRHMRLHRDDGGTHYPNPSNAQTTFVQSTRMQRFLKIIQTLSCWYSLDSSQWVSMCQGFSNFSGFFASFSVCQISHQQH